jgi:CRISPR/Cas system-associated exonuclease Cas4 (RecB family)
MPGLLHYDFALSNVFLDGTWRHLRWQMMLMEAGVVTDVEVPYKMPDKRLSVSLDAENHDEGWMFELKGTRNMPHEVPHKHLLQMHTCMYVSGFEVAVYIAENKATQDFREWVVKKDPKIMSEVTKEIYKLNEAIDERKLPGPVSDPRRKEGPCKACPYQPWCWEQRSWPYDQRWDKEREPAKVAIKRGRRKLPRA